MKAPPGTAQFQFSTLGTRLSAQVQLHPCLVWLHTTIFFTPHGISMERSRRKWPKQGPRCSLHWFSFRGDQDSAIQSPERGRELVLGAWEQPDLTSSRTGWTNRRHSEKLVFNQRQRAELFPWSPRATFTLDPTAALPSLSPSQLHFPSDGTIRLEFTSQSPTWKQETKRKTCFTSHWSSLPRSFHLGLMGPRDARFVG